MRINVNINDELIMSALELTGHKSKKAVIEEGLRLLVQLKLQSQTRGFRGKLKWTGDLDEMRADR